MKTVIMESLGISNEFLTELQKPFEAQGMEFTSFEKTTDVSTLIEQAKEADVMILANMPMPKEVIEACPQLKYIDIAFTGVDHVAVKEAKEKGVVLSNSSGYSNEAVAELTLGMVLSWIRNLRAVEDACRVGGTKDGLVGTEIKGKTVGIIGLGKIGQRSAELFHALGANVISYTRTPSKNPFDYVLCLPLEDVLSQSDFVLLHCPLTEETKGMIGKESFQKMKKSAVLVNVARGPVVNTEDLVEAIQQGEIAGACIDVFDQEPPLSKEDPILSLPNVLVTPHVAFATKESMELRAEIVFENLKNWLEGNPSNLV